MIVAIVLMGLVFIVISFMLTKDNAKQLLAGYNNLPKIEQDAINIESFVTFFCKFYQWLGGTIIVIGTMLYVLSFKDVLSYFIVLFPLFCYLYFFWRSYQFFRKGKWIYLILSIILVGIMVATAIDLMG